MEYQREYPVWPWKLWGGVEPEKAKLEMAIHRTEAQKFYEGRAGWERCGHCRARRRMLPVDGSEDAGCPERAVSAIQVRCAECGQTSRCVAATRTR